MQIIIDVLAGIGLLTVLVLHLEKAIVVVIYIALSKVTWMICVVSY